MKRLFGVTLALVIFGVLAGHARADVVWLCKPGMANDPCELGLDTTVRGMPDQVQTPPRSPEADRPFDCFYVYPTVSNQLTTNATKARDPELVSIAKYQASRFSQSCRIYAPIYRQITLAALPAATTLGQPIPQKNQDEAYGDVVEAWKDYLAHDNDGRGVVLIGHSQGSIVLRKLIAEQIDNDPAVRRRLIGGMLLGGNVVTKQGQTTGGDFQHIPVCTQRGEFGCVVAYSTYAADPPANSLFGRAPAGEQVACTDPAVLSGSDGPVGATEPSEPFAPGVIYAGILVTSGGMVPTAPTSWVEPVDRYVGACKEIGGAHVWRYDPTPGSRTPAPFLDATWGTHLLDMQLGVERLTSIVAQQGKHWQAPSLTLSRTCLAHRRGLRARVRGADVGLVSAVAFKVGSRTVARDRTAPFSVAVRRAKLRGRQLRAVATLTAGARSSLTLSRTVPACAK